MHILPAVFALAGSIALAQAQETLHKEISRSNEKELNVTIELSFGTLQIAPGEASKILVADYTRPADERSEEFTISYDVRNERGELLIRSEEKSGFWRGSRHDDESKDRTWTLRFTDAIPTSFRIELGAGKGELDLSGIRIKNLKVSSGASSVHMDCDKPNPIGAESIVIESGVSKFTAMNLTNMNFRKLKFSGGVGAYNLDFGGKLRLNADARIEVGLGAITINLPPNIPARVIYNDSWFSSFDLDDGFHRQRSGIYETESYQELTPTLSIQIESGFGSVKVRRREH